MPVRRRESAAMRRAREALADAVTGARAGGTVRLPPLRQLAARAQVSLATMARAAQVQREARVIEAVARGGFVLRGGSNSLASRVTGGGGAADSRPSVAERVRRRISSDLALGAFGFGPVMPGQRELARRYSVSIASVKKALDALVDEQRLTRHGKRFGLPHLSAAPDKVVLLIAGSDRAGHLLNVAPGRERFWTALDDACRRLAVRLIPYGYYTAVERAFKSHYRKALETCVRNQGDRLMGCIVLRFGSNRNETMPVVQTTLARRVPTVVIDQTGRDPRFHVEQLSGAGYLKWISVGGEEPGRVMARSLLAHGHRRVALFSPQDAPGWSLARTTGMRDVYREAGLEDGLAEYGLRVAQRTGRTDPLPRLPDKVADAVHTIQQELSRGTTLPERPERELLEAAASYCDSVALARSFAPLAAEALKEKDVTAWVGLNDTIAMTALEFLRHHGIAIPSRISVAGFDDSVRSACTGLTSYSFTPTVLVKQAMQFIIRDVFTGRPSTRLERVEGGVVMRGTVGRSSRPVTG